MDTGSGGRALHSCQRSTPLPPQQAAGKRFRQREGATWRNSTVSSDSHLAIGHGWLDQQHLDCFRYSYSSVTRSVCSHFLEAVLRIGAAVVMTTLRSSASYSLAPGGGVRLYTPSEYCL